MISWKLSREERLLDKKDSAEILINAQKTIKNEKSPIQKLILLNVFIQKAFKPIRVAISRKASRKCHRKNNSGIHKNQAPGHDAF